MELAYLLDPRILGIAGVVALLITDLAVWYFYPEKHKRAWKKIRNFFQHIWHYLLIVIAVVVTFALGIVAMNFYMPEATTAMYNASPLLHELISTYMVAIQVVFLGLNTVVCWALVGGHFGNQLDNGIIDDPDQKKWDDKKTLEDLERDYRIEQMRKEHRKEMEQVKESLNAILETQKAFYDNGKRFEQNPVPPEGTPERRVIVRSNPEVPITKEEVFSALPNLAIATETAVPEPVVLETVQLEPEKEEFVLPAELPKVEEPATKKAEPKKLSWIRASDLDELIFGKWGKH
ncbi:MAG: hypothetical protein WC878_06510 [Candidatus Paceibacterota bacterium]|jgi:hypothetical protein